MVYRLLLVIVFAGMLRLPASVVAQEPSGDASVTIHVVQRGETLFIIAQQYGLTVEALTQLNSLPNPNDIEVGQRLLVTLGTAGTIPAQSHVVQPGESLDSIAGLYNADPFPLAEANGVTAENPLYVGQTLVIASLPAPDAPAPEVPAEAASPATDPTRGLLHTVLDGETLFRIATQYGVTVADVAAANSIADPTLIYAGQQLLIPGVEPPQIASDMPAPAESLTVDPLILVEGQTGRIQLTTSAPAIVSGTFIGRNLQFASDAGSLNHTSLVGIPIFTSAGIYPLQLTLSDDSGNTVTVDANIQVIEGFYGSEFINLLEDRNGLLDPAVEGAEQSLVANIMSAYTPTRYFSGPMGLPAAATMTSPFGTRRSYNGGGFDRFHAGADFAGGTGTPVLASAPGVVVLADTLNVRGNATIIDHGWGVYTGYWHQTELYVQPGDIVTTGQVIGTIGSTGRVTGAHLHWELWVNGVSVDPMQWVRQSF